MEHWPHGPSHRIKDAGAYIVTAGTLHKLRLFDSPTKLALLQDLLLEITAEFGWELQAWAVFSNHYHFVGHSPQEGANIDRLAKKLHGCVARKLNRIDGTEGGKFGTAIGTLGSIILIRIWLG